MTPSGPKYVELLGHGYRGHCRPGAEAGAWVSCKHDVQTQLRARPHNLVEKTFPCMSTFNPLRSSSCSLSTHQLARVAPRPVEIASGRHAGRTQPDRHQIARPLL